jgi:hypothetical protein
MDWLGMESMGRRTCREKRAFRISLELEAYGPVWVIALEYFALPIRHRVIFSRSQAQVKVIKVRTQRGSRMWQAS